jgi:hypothetical protein
VRLEEGEDWPSWWGQGGKFRGGRWAGRKHVKEGTGL